MARVLLSSTPLGRVTDRRGNARAGYTPTITDLAGQSAVVYAADTGDATLTGARTDSYGRVSGWVEEGTYLLDGERLEAFSGSSAANRVPTNDGSAITVPLANTQGFEVKTTSPFGTFSRFRVEGNQDTQPVDINFWNCTVEFGSIAFSNSQAGAVRFLQPAAGDGGYVVTNLLNVYKPGSNSQKVYYVDPNGGQHVMCVGLASKAFEIAADGAANPVFQISETGKIQIGAGGASAPDITIDRTGAGVVKVTAATRIELDGDISFTKFAANVSFFNKSPAVGKQTVSGAKGSNAALGSLITALAAYGLISDSTTA